MAVVVGFIPTPVGFTALEAARKEAERRGGPLVIVNVVRADVESDPRHADDSQLEMAHEKVRPSSVRIEVRQERADLDDISDILLQVVEEEQAELLVLGLRREKDLARHLLGMTVQKLLISAPSDVLVV